MKVIHLATTNAGGAGIAAVRIHNLLKEMGHESHLYVQNKQQDTPDTTEVKNKGGQGKKYMVSMRFFRKLAKLMAKHNPAIADSTDWRRFRKDDVYCYNDWDEENKDGFFPGLENKIDLEDVDIIFVHQIIGYLNTYDIKRLYEKSRSGNGGHARVIFTMMDMAPVTGGCHYAWDCRGFTDTCFNCPALPFELNTRSHFQLESKAQNILYMNAEIMSNAIYDLDFAVSSAIPFSRYWQYFYPVDEEIFAPMNLTKEDGVKYLFSIANFANDVRKGFTYVLQTLLYLDSRIPEGQKIKFLCLAPELFADYKFEKIEFEKFGFCRNVNDLAKVYNKADVFLCTSVEDSAPMMLEEALLCGIPTVSFDVGTARQFIRDGKNGYVAERFNAIEFAERTYRLLYKAPETLETPSEIHDGMVKILGKTVIKNQFEAVLSCNEKYQYKKIGEK